MPKHQDAINANDAYRNQFTGRTGAPLPGCDCVQCFGYCIYDADTAAREGRLALEKAAFTREIGFDLKTFEILEGDS